MPETFFRGQIDAVLIVASWVQRLQRELGISGVSQLWSERPGWYLWLDDAPGAHELELLEAAAVGPPGSSLLRGRFGLKLYPRPDSPVFEQFSAQEQALVQGPLFDEHHTPTFEAQDKIAPHLFQVGLVEMLTTPAAEWALFSLCALDACLCREQGTAGSPATEGELVRRVPGWELSYRLFHRLLCLYAFSTKNPPARVSLVREPGFIQVLAPGREPAAEPYPGCELRSLSVLFCADPARPPRQARELMDQGALEDALFTAFDLDFACGHLHAGELGPAERGMISRDWWRYAGADYKSELASSCGCEH